MSKKLWTASRARTRRECKRKHQLEYVLGWRPVKAGDALHIGTLFHLGLEAWWKTWQLSRQDEEAFRDTFEISREEDFDVRAVQQMGRNAWAAVKGRAYDQEKQILVEEMLLAYHRRWSFEMPQWEVLSVEQFWRAPLLNPRTERASRTWDLAGKFDVIARHVGKGLTLVVEHKSSGEEIEDTSSDFWLKLRMDYQASQYYVGALLIGHEVDGLLYDVVRKTTIKPKAIKQIRQKKKETDEEFAARKAVEGRLENADEFRQRMREKFAAEPNKYIQRRLVPRLDSDVPEFMQDTWLEAKEAHESELLDRHPRNPSACHTYGTCPFWEHCSAGAPLEGNPRFERKSWVHPELPEKEIKEMEA